MGLETTYTEEIGDKICEAIANSHKSLSTICAQEGMPSRITVHKWINDIESFANKYARAKADQADLLADQILEIADSTDGDTYIDKEGKEKVNHENIQRSRLRVDARKWVASKLKPKSWGDKLDVTSGGLPVKQTFVVNGKEIEF